MGAVAERLLVSSRRVPLRAAIAATAVLCVAGSADSASAQGKLDARYVATLAGVPVGRGAWVIEISEDQYTAAASGTTTGLLRIFASGQGTGAARGTIAAGQPIPMSYASTITADKKSDEVRMVFSGGNVKDYAVDPPITPNPERVPVTDAHRRGVSDPMTASLNRVPGTADPVSAEACQRNIAVFDGRLRYDLKLAFKRMERVKTEKGYDGPAVVCAVNFTPVAGFIPDRAAVRYLVEQRDMEVWLAPVAGTRVLVLYRFSVPTPLGQAVLQATQFVSVPRASATNIRTQ
jgi:hypothetical protein